MSANLGRSESWSLSGDLAEKLARDTFGLSSLPTSCFPPFRFNFAHHHSQFKFRRNFNEEPCGPMAISPLQVGPPTGTRRELAPGLHRVARPTLNGVTRPLTSSPPICASHTVSTEHDHDSQRPVIPVETFQPDRRCENAGMTSAY